MTSSAIGRTFCSKPVKGGSVLKLDCEMVAKITLVIQQCVVSINKAPLSLLTTKRVVISPRGNYLQWESIRTLQYGIARTACSRQCVLVQFNNRIRDQVSRTWCSTRIDFHNPSPLIQQLFMVDQTTLAFDLCVPKQLRSGFQVTLVHQLGVAIEQIGNLVCAIFHCLSSPPNRTPELHRFARCCACFGLSRLSFTPVLTCDHCCCAKMRQGDEESIHCLQLPFVVQALHGPVVCLGGQQLGFDSVQVAHLAAPGRKKAHAVCATEVPGR